jgi:hypothetical protein
LRREQTAERQDVAPVSPDPVVGQGFPWLLLGGGGLMFALYKPAIALGAGGLTLAIAALQKKGWQWWVFGGLIVVVALFRLFNEQRGDTINAISAKK